MSRRRYRRPGRFRRWLKRRLKRYSRRKLREWRDRARTARRKLFAPQVVYRSAWDRQFPNPHRPAPLTMRPVPESEWRAEFRAEFHPGWEVLFTVDRFRADRSLQAYAFDAAVEQHGEIARDLLLERITPLNDAATELIKDRS